MLLHLFYLAHFALIFPRDNLDSVALFDMHGQADDFLVVIEWIVFPLLSRALHAQRLGRIFYSV